MFLNKRVFLIGFILGGYTALVFFVAKKLMEEDFNEQLDAEYIKMKNQLKEHKANLHAEKKNKEYWVHENEPEWVKRNHEAVKKLEEDFKKDDASDNKEKKDIFLTDEKTWMLAEQNGYDAVSLIFDRGTGLLMSDDGEYVDDEVKILGMTSEELYNLDKDVIYVRNNISKVVYEVILYSGSPNGELYEEE